MSNKEITVCVAYATPDAQTEINVIGEPHQNAAAFIKKSGILDIHPDIPFPDVNVGIYGRLIKLDALLQDGDRIEIYRPLMMDPKEARRRRA